MQRKVTRLLALVTASVPTLLAAAAGAQMMSERAELSPVDAAPKKAFELTVGAGYTQGFGQLQKGSANNISDVANAGFGGTLGLGYRFNPTWSVEGIGQYQEFSTTNTGGTSARGVSLGPSVTYHVTPFAKVDPFVRLGFGGRLLWQNADRTTMYTGTDWLRVTLGLDIRSTADLAIAPVLGADLTTFYRQRVGTADSDIADPRVSTFVFAGIQGRMDVGGHEVKAAPMTASAF